MQQQSCCDFARAQILCTRVYYILGQFLGQFGPSIIMGLIVLGGLGNRLSSVVSFWILFSIFYIKSVNTKIVYGHLLTGENWKFLARFCFLSDHGKFTYDIRYDASYGVQNIDLYYDTESQWSRVYGDSSDLTTCR